MSENSINPRHDTTVLARRAVDGDVESLGRLMDRFNPALVALAAAPLYIWYLTADLQLVELSALLAVLVWLKHHANIRRLLKGEEPKIGGKPS